MSIVKTFQGGDVVFKANQVGHSGRKYIGFNNGGDIGFHEIPAADMYWFDYWIRYHPGWVEGWGGKLPGLAGGTGTSGGAAIDPKGWSSRIMWGTLRTGMRSYYYHQNRSGEHADWMLFDDAHSYLPVNQWNRITQFCKVNTPGERDGKANFWVNGVRTLSMSNIEWRGRVSPSVARVDRIRNDIFRGGNTSDWAVNKDTRLSISDMHVLDCKPEFSVGGPNELPICEEEEKPDHTKVATIKMEPGTFAVMEDNTIVIYRE